MRRCVRPGVCAEVRLLLSQRQATGWPWPRRSGGRQRRARVARRRQRCVRTCYVGVEEAGRRFMARADARGWLESGTDDESDYYSVTEEEGVLL